MPVWIRKVRVWVGVLVRSGVSSGGILELVLRVGHAPFASTSRVSLHPTVSAIHKHILINNFLP